MHDLVVLLIVLALMVLLPLPWVGEYLLKNGKTARIRRLGWRMLYFVDCVGYAGVTDGGARVYKVLNEQFIARYGERP
jgi:hypothetical protein